MRMQKLVLPALVALLFLWITPGRCGAGPLTSIDASTVVQGTVPDLEFFFLFQFAGFQNGQTLDFNASSTETAWNGTLTGTYEGLALNVAYSSDLSAFPGGPVTWTSSGSYGASPWAGNGSAQFTLLPMDDFQIALTSSLTVGSNTGTSDLTIFGNSTGDIEVFEDLQTGTESVNGMALPPEKTAKITFKRKDFIFFPDDIEVKGGVLGISHGDLKRTTTGFDTKGTLKTMPEPSTLTLFGIGTLGLLGGIWRRGRTKDRR